MFSCIFCCRFSTPLFRLPTAAAITSCMTFHNNGPAAKLGVIVYHIENPTPGEPGHDVNAMEPLVVFNARPDNLLLDVAGIEVKEYTLHPIQVSGSDPVVKESVVQGSRLSVPPRTCAVFVR